MTAVEVGVDEVVLYAPTAASVAVIRCSPPSWMCRLALEEKGVAHRVRWLDFARGEHRSPEMLRRNPRGTVPVLGHGPRSVYETFAILSYLEAAFPDPPLLPTDLDALAPELSLWHLSDGLKSAGMAWFAWLMRTPAGERGAGEQEALRERFEGALSVWENLVAERPRPWGSRPTLADLSVFAYVATAAWVERSAAPHPGGPLHERHPALAGFMARMAERPSVRATWPDAWGPPPDAEI